MSARSLAECLFRPVVLTRPLRLVEPNSWVAHIPFAFWLVEAVRPRVLVELGTHSGNSYAALVQATEQLGLQTACYAVDTWRGDEHATFYSEDVFSEWSEFHDRHFSGRSRLLRSSFDEARDHFADGSIDLLHIDGLHTYEAVAHDFETWLAKLSTRAVVLLHDTNVRERGFGVWKLWEELKQRYPAWAFMHGHGLGLLAVGQDIPPAVQWLTNLPPDSRERVVVSEFFRTLGEALRLQLLSEEQRHTIASAQADVIAAGERAEQLQFAADQLRERMGLVEAHAKALERSRDQLDAELNAARAEVERTRAIAGQLRDADQRLADALAQSTRAEHQATAQAEQAREAKQRLADAEGRAARLEQHLQEARARVEQAEQHAASQSSHLQVQRRSLQYLHGESDRVRRQVRAGISATIHRDAAAVIPRNVLSSVRRALVTAGLSRRSAMRRPVRFIRAAARLTRLEYRRYLSQLAASGLFDAAYYRRVTGLTAADDLVGHFVNVGDQANVPPHPLFDPEWYRSQSSDVAPTAAPFRHYLEFGGWAMRSPHPLFDPRYYAAQWPAGLAGSASPLSHLLQAGVPGLASPHPLFNLPYYFEQRPDVLAAGVHPLLHYLETAHTEAVDPHPLFSTRYYLDQNPDVGSMNPLVHFLRQGAGEGRSPHPLFEIPYYWKQRPDVKAAGVNPLLHYLETTFREQTNPHPLFDVAFYLEQAIGLELLGVDPLVHFLRWGAADGLSPNAWFDVGWYREQYPDIGLANPLLHFMTRGWRQGRDPSPAFSVAEYLATNPDLLRGRQDPLDHFLRGGADTRSPVRRLGPAPTTVASAERTLADLSGALPYTAIFRFRLPVSAAPAAIEETVRSLKAQLYPRWRLTLVDDDLERARAAVAAYPDDARITSGVGAPTRYSVSEEDEEGQVWLGRLQPGDSLSPEALLLVVNALTASPEAVAIYTDEDSPSSAPIYKPGWDPLLFATVDYLGPGGFVRASALGDSTAHQALREALAVTPRHLVVHLPALLTRPGVCNSYASRLPPTVEVELAADAAVTVYGGSAKASQLDATPLVSIVIPTRNRVDLLRTCIESIATTSYPAYEILVVDNGSDDAEARRFLASLVERPRCHVLERAGPFNYSALNNHAVEHARGQVLCLLNNDIELTTPDWLTTLVAYAALDGVGAVGAVLHYPDSSIQHGGVVLGAGGVAAHAFAGAASAEETYMQLARFPREVAAVTGACLVLEKTKFQRAGGFDEALAVNFSDVDLCLKVAENGYHNIVLPLSGIVHHESASRKGALEGLDGRNQLSREARIMTERWGRRLLNDPYYSGHLSLSEPLFEKAEVSRVEPLVAATGQPRKFTALARDSRLDVYATADNERRVLEATRAVAAEACPEGSPGLSVVVLTKDRPDLIGRLVPELAAQGEAFHAEDLGYEVLIGDTGSTDHQVLELYRRLPPCARVTTGLEYNFSRCNNQLAAAAAFDTLLFLNNDVIFSGSTEQLIRGYHTLASDPGLGILGAVLHFPDGTIQHMGCEWLRETARWGLPYHVKARTRVPTRELPSLAHYPAVTGAFLLIGRSLFGHCGGFDPAYAAECQDAALCVEAARLGYEIACADLGHIIHIENGTRPTGEEHMADRQRFLRKAGAFIQASLS